MNYEQWVEAWFDWSAGLEVMHSEWAMYGLSCEQVWAM